LKSSQTAEAAPGQLLGELFGPLVGGNQGDTKIRDPRAGQGLVEAAIKATKTVSQLMNSVLQVKGTTAVFYIITYFCRILR
jgi:hypothetical protein